MTHLERNQWLFDRVPTVTAAVLALVCLGWWMGHDPSASLTEFRPGMDGRPEGAGLDPNEVVNIGEFFESFDTEAGDMAGEWIQFRGQNSDNILSEGVALARSWPEDGPPELWSIDLGEGHAGAAVAAGRVYVLDYDEEAGADVLRCLSLANGRELWKRWYEVRIKRNHGLSRTVPATNGEWVVTLGPRCHVMAVHAITGDLLWGMDLERDYGSQTPFWYTGQCPIIDDGVVVLAPAGDDVLLMGVDCATGEIVWHTPNLNGWQMSHTSVMPMELSGRRMYVYSAIGGIVGVAADGEDRGQILWQTDLWSRSVLAPSPVVLPDGRIYVTAGYGAGSMMLKVTPSDDGFSVTKLQEIKPTDGLASEQQTALLYDGHLIAIRPKDGGEYRQQLVCVHPDDCTQMTWASGPEQQFGLGPYLIADDKVFVLDDDGVLTLLEASTRHYRQLAQAQVLDGHDAWAPMALAGSRLVLRDSKRMVCLDVGLGAGEGV
ncbi:MAG: PQQ-like beta-propeller repeat protein [bacterium]|nr:PQQ-like beta-propeller repeat protein [bacterium]